MIDPSEVVTRVATIRSHIAELTDRSVSIVAVTKTFPVAAWHVAADAGCDALGENYAQEVLAKVEEMAPPLPLHFIGALQSNKVRALAPHISLWQGVDRVSVIDEIARRAPSASVLLQVNTTGEESKSGVAPHDLDALLHYSRAAGLSVLGLMTLGPTDGSPSAMRDAFTSLRRLADERGLVECSMGMSGDYRLAVECGATMIRLGSVLFGQRSSSLG